MYWKKNAGTRIEDFMENGIKKSHFIIGFFSEKYLKSSACINEWALARLLDRSRLIISYNQDLIPDLYKAVTFYIRFSKDLVKLTNEIICRMENSRIFDKTKFISPDNIESIINKMSEKFLNSYFAENHICHYIKPKVQIRSNFVGNLDEISKDNIINYFEKSKNHIDIITGISGSGKSTFVAEIAKEMIKSNSKAKNSIIIYIRLGNYSNFQFFFEDEFFLSKILKKWSYGKINDDFRLENKQTYLIFDGLDEIYPYLHPDLQNISKFLHLFHMCLQENVKKIIIATRKSVFSSSSQEKQISKLKYVNSFEILEWDHKEISQWIESNALNKEKMTKIFSYERPSVFYYCNNLASNPFMLKSLDRCVEKINFESKFNEIDIYNSIIQEQIELAEQKYENKNNVGKLPLIDFLCVSAYCHSIEGYINLETVKKIKEKFQFKFILPDIYFLKNLGFIKFIPEIGYLFKFIHHSYYEFFLALFIQRNYNSRKELISAKYINNWTIFDLFLKICKKNNSELRITNWKNFLLNDNKFKLDQDSYIYVLQHINKNFSSSKTKQSLIEQLVEKIVSFEELDCGTNVDLFLLIISNDVLKETDVNLKYLILEESNMNFNIKEKAFHIPQNIGYCKELEYLDLSHNFISFLPKSIGELKKLKHLNLEDNWLRYIPNTLGNLENLEILNLAFNGLKTIPNFFSKMQNLKELHLYNNKLEFIPDSLCDLKSLSLLDLSSNKLRYMPDKIFKLNNLIILSISDNEIESINCPIGSFKKLEDLYLGRNLLKTIPLFINKMTNLNILSIEGNNVSILPKWLGDLTNLLSLNVARNLIKELPFEIRKLKNLKEFEIDNNPIKILPDIFYDMSQIDRISLGNTKITKIPLSLKRLYVRKHDENSIYVLSRINWDYK